MNRRALYLICLWLPCLLFSQPASPIPPPDAEEGPRFPEPAPWDPWVDYSRARPDAMPPPPIRAEDWIATFRQMREANPDASIYAIADGQSIDHIIDMQLAPRATLIYLVTEGSTGQRRTLTIPVETLEKLDYRRRGKRSVQVNSPD